MNQATPLLVQPTRRHFDEESEAHKKAAPMLGHSGDDTRLAEQVERALRSTGYGPLRNVAISAFERIVILQGRVHSYHLKQVAQETALTVPGVHMIRNDLEVTPGC